MLLESLERAVLLGGPRPMAAQQARLPSTLGALLPGKRVPPPAWKAGLPTLRLPWPPRALLLARPAP